MNLPLLLAAIAGDSSRGGGRGGGFRGRGSGRGVSRGRAAMGGRGDSHLELLRLESRLRNLEEGSRGRRRSRSRSRSEERRGSRNEGRRRGEIRESRRSRSRSRSRSNQGRRRREDRDRRRDGRDSRDERRREERDERRREEREERRREEREERRREEREERRRQERNERREEREGRRDELLTIAKCPYCQRKKGATMSEDEERSDKRSIAEMIEWSQNGECGMKRGYEPLLNVDPSRFVPGAMHTVTGAFISICLNELLLAAKYADLKNVQSLTLSMEEEDEDFEGELEQQIHVERTINDYKEKIRLDIVNLTQSLNSSRLAIAQSETVIDILSHIRDRLIEPPKPKDCDQRCASPFCLSVDKAFKKLSHKKGNRTVWDWVLCESCEMAQGPKDYHFVCEMILSPEHVLKLSEETEGYDCLNCINGDVVSIEERIERARKVLEEEKEAVPKIEAKIAQCKSEQEELSVVFTSKKGDTQKALDDAFKKKGADMQRFGQRVTGNHMYNLLKPGVPEYLWSLVPNAQNRAAQLDLWHEFHDLQRLTAAHKLSRRERDDLRACIKEIQRLCAEYVPHLSLSPKKHILFHHVMEIVDALPCWGEMSDQGVEALNQDEKRGMEKFACIRNKQRRWREWVKERERKNVMHDRGLDGSA